MRSSFFGIHVAASGLNTARGNLNVISHNIANAEIPGFSRQVAQMQAGRPLTVGSGRGMYGTGSQITSVIQIRDQFLDRKFWTQSGIHGRFTAVHSHLAFVETVFNELPNAGVKRTFNTFFSTLQDLTTRAHEPTFRTNVTTNAHSLTEQVRSHAAALQRQQIDLNREFANVVTIINSLGQQIAGLNEQIHIFERDGSNANDLRDQRALLIDRLSELVNVDVEERDFSRPGMQNDRRVNIRINGYMFIDHTFVERLQLVARDNPDDARSGMRRNEMDAHGLYDLVFERHGSRFDIYSPTLKGTLRGIIDVRDGNGGQVTMPPVNFGSALVGAEMDALDRTVAFLDSIVPDMPNSGDVTAVIALRDGALDALTDIVNTVFDGMPLPAGIVATPMTTQVAMNLLHYLENIQAERTALGNAFATQRTNILNSINISTLRATVNSGFPAGGVPAGITSLMDDIDSHLAILNSDPPIATIADLDAWRAGLDTLLNNLLAHAEFPSPLPATIENAINARINGINAWTAPFNTALTRHAEIAVLYGDHAALGAQITDVRAHINDLNTAIRDINRIVNTADRVDAQISWAIQNAERMATILQERLADMEAGRIPGDSAAIRLLLEGVEPPVPGGSPGLLGRPFIPPATAAIPGYIERMQDLLDDVRGVFPAGIDNIYATTPAHLNDLIDALTSAISGAGAEFHAIIDNIGDAVENLNYMMNPDGSRVLADGAPVRIADFAGDPRFNGVTSNFKGIPFYMNQLNELVRTFSRGMNEGRNRGGDMITGAIGHINGFDANGENRQALFFTMECSRTGEHGTLDHDDPLRSLRRWILAGADGVPLRDSNGDMITVGGPVPPGAGVPARAFVGGVYVEVDSYAAVDSMGRSMFTIDYSQFNALNFAVNPELLAQGGDQFLAASSNANIGQANNDIIHGFLAVGSDVTLFREGRLIDFIIATNNHLAVDNNQAEMFRLSYEEMTMQTHNHRLSVSSVDTEEEMLNLVRFQNMFIAASRLINVLDTVYDTLINRLGNF